MPSKPSAFVRGQISKWDTGTPQDVVQEPGVLQREEQQGKKERLPARLSVNRLKTESLPQTQSPEPGPQQALKGPAGWLAAPPERQ